MEKETTEVLNNDLSQTGNSMSNSQTQNQTQNQNKGGEIKNVDNTAEKMYSKSEFDLMVSKQYNAGIISAMKEAGFNDIDEKNFKESLSAFKKWNDDQKTAEQLMKEELENTKKQAMTATQELEKFKQYEVLRGKGVKDSFLKYVQFEVNEIAKNDNVDFKVALDTFSTANANYFTSDEDDNQKSKNRVVTVVTSPNKETPPNDVTKPNFRAVRNEIKY